MSDSSATQLKCETEIKRYRLFLTLFLTLIAIAPTNASSTWTSRATSQNWYGITSSSDGTKLAAVANGGNIWTSTDSGANWVSRATSQDWVGITSSSDGTKLAAVAMGGNIWTSTDSGANWVSRATSQSWVGITSSSDGTKLAAVAMNIWTSSSTCDASAAPTNGGAGNCTSSLASGSTCQPTCDSGYTVSGTSSCTAGTLTAAACTSDENKYICLDPTKFQGSKMYTLSGTTTSCDTWVDLAQGSGQVFYGITFDSTFDASAQTTTVQNGLKMYAGPYGGNGGNCCSDGKSAAFKNHTYFCQDANDWLPDKTYTFSGGGTSTCTEWLEFDATGLTNEDFTASWSCDGKSDAIRQKVQNEGAEIIGCCGSSKRSACWKDPPSAPPPPSVNTTSPPPPPSPPPDLIKDDDDHAAGLAGILVALVATIFNML